MIKLTETRTISQINEKIDNGEANIYTVDEFKISDDMFDFICL